MSDGYAELEFDLPRALLRDIVALLDGMNSAELTALNLTRVSDAPGVYALSSSVTGELLYIGKAESSKGLLNRLTRHMRKLDGRQYISPGDIHFKAIRIFVFAAMDLEAALISHYGGEGKLPWNHSGFGSNDPGQQRDTTTYKPDHFDTQHPIRLDHCFVEFKVGKQSVADVMQHLKDGLPFLLRFQRPNATSRNSFEPDFEAGEVDIPRPDITTREVLERCIAALPSGWHATALPSHVICYKNDDRRFPSGTLITRS
ncbi:GIY-YIG nuclease family protein [Pararhodobacter zhoushanensis]|uniref:GIY-YIG nuclease family protein n=1 Tax=Pararhodobacter zhoushanensis TaxID=2479545 RepID=A0ABT3H1Q8_9RHOB|nr:GIY-YIG nuclease family protein [Pararhodobacter zhoushanensis]MCW1933711.1 GIY-YIG nuclease family protein [Pararhodobacter zhoushanensis]